MNFSRSPMLALALLVGCSAPVGTLAAGEAGPAELVVRFRDGVAEAERQAVRARYAPGAEVGQLPGTEKWRLPGGTLAADLAARVAAEPAIKYASPNFRRQLQAYKADELTTSYPDGQWALEQIRAPEAWGKYFSAEAPPGKGVTVAVIDSGVDVRHPDLASNIVRDPQGKEIYIDVLRDASGSTDVCRGFAYDWATAYRDSTHPGPDGHGHGTHVAGIIAAAGNNTGYGSRNLVGVAPAAQILPVKVMDCRGGGEDWDIAYGIKAAADRGARVMNLSIGGPEPSPILEDALGYARDRGALLVVAAGNGGGAPVFYPAAYAGVVAVGAVNKADEYQDFSNVGQQMGMVAPGGTRNQSLEGILSTVPFYSNTMAPAGIGWARVSGTSQASPYVAGAAALIWSREPSLTADQVRSRLYAAAKDLAPAGFDSTNGWGRLDVIAALSLGDHRYAAP